MHAAYSPALPETEKNKMKQTIVPSTVQIHISGRGAHARDVIRTQINMAKIPAAAGGILRSKLFGSFANPRLAMIVGRYQLNAYVARFMSVWSSRNAQVVGALKAIHAYEKTQS